MPKFIMTCVFMFVAVVVNVRGANSVPSLTNIDSLYKKYIQRTHKPDYGQNKSPYETDQEYETRIADAAEWFKGRTVNLIGALPVFESSDYDADSGYFSTSRLSSFFLDLANKSLYRRDAYFQNAFGAHAEGEVKVERLYRVTVDIMKVCGDTLEKDYSISKYTIRVKVPKNKAESFQKHQNFIVQYTIENSNSIFEKEIEHQEPSFYTPHEILRETCTLNGDLVAIHAKDLSTGEIFPAEIIGYAEEESPQKYRTYEKSDFIRRMEEIHDSITARQDSIDRSYETQTKLSPDSLIKANISTVYNVPDSYSTRDIDKELSDTFIFLGALMTIVGGITYAVLQ